MTRRIPNAEATAHPWWLIIDPGAIGRGPHSVDAVAHAITGPFLSRESAQAELDGRPHAYGPRARVYCHSGHRSPEWRQLCAEEAP